MQYQYSDDFQWGLSVFAIFSNGVAVLGLRYEGRNHCSQGRILVLLRNVTNQG